MLLVQENGFNEESGGRKWKEQMIQKIKTGRDILSIHVREDSH